MSQGMWAVSKDGKRQENSPLKPPKRRETCFRLLNHNKVSEVKSLSHVRLFATPWTIAHRASLSIGFSRQEYWSGLPFPAPGDLPNPGIELVSPCTSCIGGRFFTTEPLGKPIMILVGFNLDIINCIQL